MELAYPLRIGPNGDIQLIDGYDYSVRQSLYFILDTFPQSVVAFPEIGVPIQLFELVGNDPLTHDVLREKILENEPRVKDVYNISSMYTSDGLRVIDFDYITQNNEKGHWSTSYFEVQNA